MDRVNFLDGIDLRGRPKYISLIPSSSRYVLELGVWPWTCVHMDTVVVHPLGEFLQDEIVPARDANLAAADQRNARVHRLEGVGPLVGLGGVCLGGELSDLPFA